ncbi:MAG TPA: alpha/beta hydrolase [Pseudonocardiaceae bacterium]|nr:alpha/beta hydrolase [Pseudonocardiaceae bacterium]
MSVAEVSGRSIHYETAGEGTPVVLLHGALCGAEIWAGQVPALTGAGFRVWTPERSGHGHSPDVPGPFSYDEMAEQTATFLNTVVGERAHLVGWSDGAVVGALVARHWPDLVDRLVLIGQHFDPSGEVQDSLSSQLIAQRDDPPAFLRAAYAATSPDGADHFPVVYAKTIDMVAGWPGIDFTELAKISAPTLVIQGDYDEVLLEHSAAVVTAIAPARLAVLPGTHALPMESPQLVNPVLIDFLLGAESSSAW